LILSRITFIRVSLLNDPFDPYFVFETSFDASYERLLDYVNRRSPEDLEWFTRRVPLEHWEISVQGIKTHMDNYRKSTFVFSCSAVTKHQHPKNNLYMWRHYANGHRGIAIEYDASKASSLLQRHPRFDRLFNTNSDQAWMQIQYATDIGVITPKMMISFFRASDGGSEKDFSETELANYYRLQPITKSVVWRQENEWRMLWQNDETRLKVHRAPIPSDAIIAVYVGLSASSGTENDILFEAERKFPTARIFRAFKKQGFSEL
jgi:hypothetical protein